MTTNLDPGLGAINGPAVGIIMKEMVRRAITTIRNERRVFEVSMKKGNTGSMDDVFTTADKKAQMIYLRSITECFTTAGIIAEEDSLTIPCMRGCTAYFTVDPLDGTKAFIRRQSHGVGSMVALVQDGQVISAWIGDVNTQEIYGFRPGSDKVHRISDFDTSEHLTAGDKLPLKEQYVMLRDPESKYGALSRRLIQRGFKNQIIDGGSIGTWLARLWKREVAAAIMLPGWDTPWDTTPIVGISLKLGYRFFKPVHDASKGEHWQLFSPILPTEKLKHDHDILVIHENDVGDLNGSVVPPI